MFILCCITLFYIVLYCIDLGVGVDTVTVLRLGTFLPCESVSQCGLILCVLVLVLTLC